MFCLISGLVDDVRIYTDKVCLAKRYVREFSVLFF